MMDYLTRKYFQFIKMIDRIVLKLSFIHERAWAKKLRREHLKQSGKKSVLTRKLKREIKDYCKERFGSRSYWTHLAKLTEIKGEFTRGWIPEDYFKYILEPKLNPKAYVNLGDMRSIDHRRFGDFAIKPLFLFIMNNFYNADFEVIEVDEVRKALEEYNETIVLKQEFSWGGKDVRVIHSTDFKPEQLQKDFNYIIQPFLKQHSVLNELYPHSVNTIRVITFQKKNGSIEVLYHMLRFGVDGIKVDNLSSGGECIYIDPTGRAAKSGYTYWGLQTGEFHKNTGYRFADLQIPGFHKIGDACINAHQKYPYLRMIGWDICLHESGEPKLIEWNTDSPSFTWEDALFGPFLTDDSEIQ